MVNEMQTVQEPTPEIVDAVSCREVSAQLQSMPIPYSVSDQKIAQIRQKCSGMVATTKEGYEEVRLAISTTRKLRVAIEEQRKNLKDPALEFGRRVDAEAKRLTGLLVEIEKPLQAEKDRADAEKERVKKEAAEAARLKLEARLEKLKQVDAMIAPITVEHWTDEEFETNLGVFATAKQAAIQAAKEEADRKAKEEADRLEAMRLEQIRLDAERAELASQKAAAEEANRKERERIEAEQAAERQRLEAERVKAEEALQLEREKLKEERDRQEAHRKSVEEKIEADRRAVQAERDRLQAEESARLARIQAEADEKARIEREAKEAAERDELAKRLQAEELELARIAAERAEALKPDKAKIAEAAKTLRAIKFAETSTAEGSDFVRYLRTSLESLACECEVFCDA